MFDALWLSGRYTREGAYFMVSRLLGHDASVDSGHFHIGSMGIAECAQLIELVQNLPDELKEDSYEDLERTVVQIGAGRFCGKQYRHIPIHVLEQLLKEARGTMSARLARYLDHPRTLARSVEHQPRRKLPKESCDGAEHFREPVFAKRNRGQYRRGA